jgi:hypothetical protein
MAASETIVRELNEWDDDGRSSIRAEVGQLPGEAAWVRWVSSFKKKAQVRIFGMLNRLWGDYDLRMSTYYLVYRSFKLKKSELLYIPEVQK